MGFTVDYSKMPLPLKYVKAVQDAVWYVPDIKKLEKAVIENCHLSLGQLVRAMAWAGLQGLPAKRLVLEIFRNNS